MKTILTAFSCFTLIAITAQIETPQPSPSAKLTQSVGLNTIEIEYSRPLKRDRVIFGDLVPYDKLWRTGANKNTVLITSDLMIFGKDTLLAGSYAIYTKPIKDANWEVYFYSDTENWGTPKSWDDSKIALKTMAASQETKDVVESFTISLDNVDSDGADLVLTWDKSKATISFKVPTNDRVAANIKSIMSGPTAGDYYKAAEYYLSQKIELATALEYINKALDKRDPQPFWYLRKKALIEAEMGDYKKAVKTAKLSLAAAKKANYDSYVKSNEKSIEEWSKKK